jgi:hypothetical protein
MEITSGWEPNKQSQGDTILRLLNRKFSTLPDLLIRQLESLSPHQLDSLAEDLLGFHTVADLQVWLINS